MLDINRKLVEQKFGEVFLSSGNEYKVRCPECGKKAKWVNPAKGMWKCFSCNKGGKININGATNLQRPKIAKMYDSVLPGTFQPVLERRDFPKGWDYIIQRGFNPESIYFGYSNQTALLFPCVENGRTVYYSTRSIYNVIRIKAENAPRNRTGGLGKENWVYNIDSLSEGGLAIATEGIFSSFACAGLCTYGKTLSDVQIDKIIARKPMLVLMAYDTDAKSQIENAVKRFRDKGFKRVAGLYLPDDLDPADLGYVKFFGLVSKKLRFLHQTGVLKLLGLSYQESEKLLQEKLKDAEQYSLMSS